MKCHFALCGSLLAALILTNVGAAQVDLKSASAKPVLPAGQKQLTHLKVGLTGFEMPKQGNRAPVNLAIVLDRSGSMSGEKIAQARTAAMMAVRSLAPTDIVSVITFDDNVDILVAATKASDRDGICQKIDSIQVGGGTGLFAGVSKGAGELRKFISKECVNRVILLSDGQANKGPSSPAELAELGASVIKEGISVTTIGLGAGYNEDLMTQLAQKSDGRHAYVQNPKELVSIFEDEIGSVNAVVAQKIKIDVLCDPGVRPVRVLGRDATIAGQKVTLELNQIYSGEEKYAILEVEVPESTAGLHRDLARVEVSYDNLSTKAVDHLVNTVAVRFSDSSEEVEKSVNKDVLVAAVTQIATLKNEEAIQLRDKGRVEEAKKALLDNAAWLGENAARYRSTTLSAFCESNVQDAANVDKNWAMARKMMKDTNYQQSFSQGKDIEKAVPRKMALPADSASPAPKQ